MVWYICAVWSIKLALHPLYILYVGSEMTGYSPLYEVDAGAEIKQKRVDQLALMDLPWERDGRYPLAVIK